MRYSNSNGSTYNGIGFVGLLTIAFIVLKLTDVISWSWIWVLSPLWISVIVLVGIVVLIVMMDR